MPKGLGIRARVVLAGIAIIGLAFWNITNASAAPLTEHFDELIDELESRAAALSNSASKAEQKQFKAIHKSLALLSEIDSTNIDTDIKAAAKIAKTLAKGFPAQFNTRPASGETNTLSLMIQDVLYNLAGDISDLFDDALDDVDALAPSVCRDNADILINKADEALAAASDTETFSELAKMLSKAYLALVDAQEAIDACAAAG